MLAMTLPSIDMRTLPRQLLLADANGDVLGGFDLSGSEWELFHHALLQLRLGKPMGPTRPIYEDVDAKVVWFALCFDRVLQSHSLVRAGDVPRGMANDALAAPMLISKYAIHFEGVTEDPDARVFSLLRGLTIVRKGGDLFGLS